MQSRKRSATLHSAVPDFPDLMKTPTSSDLHDAYRAGDIAAFHELFDRYSMRILAWVSYYIHDPELVRDAAQDSWIAVLRGEHRVRGRFRSWVFSIVANRARSLASREERMRKTALTFRAAGGPADGFRRVAVSEKIARLSDALQKLPQRQRRVFVLRDVGGQSSDEVCRRLSISPENERVLLHRARKTLRLAVAEDDAVNEKSHA